MEDLNDRIEASAAELEAIGDKLKISKYNQNYIIALCEEPDDIQLEILIPNNQIDSIMICFNGLSLTEEEKKKENFIYDPCAVMDYIIEALKDLESGENIGGDKGKINEDGIIYAMTPCNEEVSKILKKREGLEFKNEEKK